jgi:hypothetical protein
MLSRTLRSAFAALLLTALVATDALPVFPVSRRQCDMACCRMKGAMGHGEACRLRPAAAARCAVGMSDSLPASFQGQREIPVRSILRGSRPGEVVLASAGWVAEARTIVPPSPLFEPPVPPPRSLRFA